MTHQLEHDARHRYRCINPDHADQPCAGKVFQSVTTILGKAVPKDLAWHGQTRGIVGVKGLMRLPQYDIRSMSVGDITGALKRERLTVNDHRDQAAEGGTALHNALEDYINRGVLPVASKVPESKRKSIEGLAKFIIEYRPEFLAAEVRTLSIEHEYAGTFDFLANIHAELYTIPRRGGGKYLKLRPAGSTLFVLGDMKNSKWVYPSSHFTQLEAYEGARREAGEPPTDVRAVLWLNESGDMELVPSTATFDDFLALKASAGVLSRLDSTWQRPRKARA